MGQDCNFIQDKVDEFTGDTIKTIWLKATGGLFSPSIQMIFRRVNKTHFIDLSIADSQRQLPNLAISKGSKLYTYTKPVKGKNAGLTKFNNTIYYAYKDGIFKLNQKTKQFERDQSLSAVFDNNEYTSGKLILDNSNKLWIFSKSYINYFSVNKLSSDLKKNVISIPASISNSMLGYENITQLSNSIYLIGTTDGYYTFNINELSFKNHSVAISDISINKLNEKQSSFSISDKGEFKHDENNITFSYTVPEYDKYIIAEYQYLLNGFQDNWSEWSSKSTINFKNLPPGD